MGRGVVGPRADRVGRRPLAAAGARGRGGLLGARGPAGPLFTVRAWEGGSWRRRAGSLLSLNAAASPPDVTFPVDPAPLQNHQTAWRAPPEPDPQPLRAGRAGTERIELFWFPNCGRQRVGTGSALWSPPQCRCPASSCVRPC